MKALLLPFSLLALSGCLAGAGPDAAPTEVDGTSERIGFAPEDAPGSVDGTLHWSQAAAVVCPLYFESPASHSLARLPPLAGAVSLDLQFNWTPATPVFESAILSMDGYVRNGAPGEEIQVATIRGGPGVTWRLEGADLERFWGKDVYLYIEGPDCAANSQPAKTGIDYEQSIGYKGLVTFAT